MSVIKTIDDMVKGISNDKVITIHDNFDLQNAIFLSSRDKVESIDASNPTEDRQFAAAATKIKKLMGDRSAIVAKADATHYGYVNQNYYWYNPKLLRANAKTWIKKTTNGSWGKPVQKDHSIGTEDTLGRVLVATPFLYGNDAPGLFDAEGHIQLIYYVSDSEAIEKMIDGRFRTLSVSSSTSIDQVTCSICGLSVNDWDCSHGRGKTYELAKDVVSTYEDRTNNSALMKNKEHHVFCHSLFSF